MEHRGSKSDRMEGDNKSCHHPRGLESVAQKRWCKIENIFQVFKMNAAHRKQARPHKSLKNSFEALLLVSFLEPRTAPTWFVETKHVSSERDRQDCLVAVVKRLILELLHGQWMGSWLTGWIYGHNNSTQGDCEYKPISRFVQHLTAPQYINAQLIGKSPNGLY